MEFFVLTVFLTLLETSLGYVSESGLVGHESATRFDFGDDSYTLVPTSGSYKFLGNSYSQIYANGNGVITMGEGGGYYRFNCNRNSSTTPTIGAYMIDSLQTDDVENAKLLYQEFLYSTSPTSFASVTKDVSLAFSDFKGQLEKMVVVTWKNIPVRGQTAFKHLRNTFQAVLAAQGGSTFLLFYYSRIEWPSKVAVAPPSEAGIYGGRNNLHNTYMIPGSCNSSLINIAGMSNIGKPGKFVFKVDRLIEKPKLRLLCIPETLAPRSVDFKPRVVSALGIKQLLVTGMEICQEHNITVVWCKFHQGSQAVPRRAAVIPGNLGIVCPTPNQFSSLGKVRVTLEITFMDNRKFTTEGYIIVSKQELSKSVVYRESTGYFTALWNPFSFQTHPLNKLYTNLLGRQSPLENVDVSIMELRNSVWRSLYVVRNVSNSGHLSIRLPENITMALTSENEDMTPKCYMVTSKMGIDYGPFVAMELSLDVIGTTIAFGSWRHGSSYENNCKQGYSRVESVQNDSLPCPETLKQAFYDWRFTYDSRDAVAFSYMQIMPSPSGSGSKCSYNRIGKLSNTTRHPSHSVSYSPSSHSNLWEYYSNEFIPEINCCTLANSINDTCANFYMKKRPIPNGYKFPKPFKINGATHFNTPEGISFPLNAVGSFWLIKSQNLSFQILSEPYHSGTQFTTTVITAAVMTGERHGRLQVVAVPSGLQIWMDEQPLNFYRTDIPNSYEYMTDSFEIYGNVVTVLINGTKSALFVYSCGLSVKFTPSKNGKPSLNIIGSMSEELQSKVDGLLGNFDGKLEYELEEPGLREESLIPDGDLIVHQVEKWRVSRHEFLFWFPIPRDYTKLNANVRAIQKHPKVSVADGNLSSICGNITECNVDSILTNNTGFVNSSLSVYLEYTEMLKQAIHEKPYKQEKYETTLNVVTTLPSSHTNASSHLIPVIATFVGTIVFCGVLFMLYAIKVRKSRRPELHQLSLDLTDLEYIHAFGSS